MARVWLKRNLVSLVVIVVCIPALVWMTMGVVLVDRAAYGPKVVAVASGDTVELGGYVWELTESRSFTGDDLETDAVPGGAEIVAALLNATPVPGAEPTDEVCSTELTAPSSSAFSTEQRRTWSTVLSPYDFNYGLLDDSTGFCSPDGEPLQLETLYLVPKNVYGVATVDMTMTGSTTIYRFDLVPDP